MIQILLAGLLATAEAPAPVQDLAASPGKAEQENIAAQTIRQIRCFARTIEPVAAGRPRDRNPLLLVNGRRYGLVFQVADRCSGKEKLPRGVTSVEYLIPSAAREDFGDAAKGGLVRVEYTRPRPRG